MSMSRLQAPRGHTASVTSLEMASEKSCNVSELEAGDNTTVHGHILDLSPIKTSKNKPDCSYFNGKLSDGLKVARFVSFEPELRLSLDRFRQEKKAVALSGCRIQNNKFDSSLEIMAGLSVITRSLSV